MKIFIILFVALIFRLSIMFVAYHGDLNNNISWGNAALDRGFVDFYEGKEWQYSAPNQPPLTILMFTFTSWVWSVVENTIWYLNNTISIFPSTFIWFWETKGMTMLVKLPSIFADLVIGYLIYRYFEKEKGIYKYTLPIIWLINPISWYNSAIWGQTDSIVNVLGLASVLFLFRRSLVGFSVMFTLSLLFKGSLALLLPLLLYVVLKQKYSRSDWVKAFVSSLVTVVLISVWFHPKVDLLIWLVNLYQVRIFPGEIGYLSANAFNLWWLVDSGKTLDSVVYFGLPARTWGFVITLGSMVAVMYWMKSNLKPKTVFLSISLLAIIIFLFMTRIHERYLYPFFPYATFLIRFIPSSLYPYIVLSFIHILNLYHLFWAPSFAPLEGLYLNPQFAQALSLVSILMLFWYISLASRKNDKNTSKAD